MNEFNKVIDYIIDQSNKYDARNLQIENDVQFILKKEKDKLDTSVLTHSRSITNLLQLTTFMESITKVFRRFTHQYRRS